MSLGAGRELGILPVAVALLACLLLFFCAGGKTFAAEGKSCATAECHTELGQEKYLHGPVAVGDCTYCHRPGRPGKHNFEPIKDVGSLCTECHERQDVQKVVHAPAGEGECTACHDPHQSSNRYQLRSSGAELCFGCHDRAMAEAPYVHGPAAVGSCNTCHLAHQSDAPGLLVADGNRLCFECHIDKAEAFEGRRFTHAPVQDACVNCHSPHAAGYRYQLRAEGNRDLCFFCHGDKEEEIEAATVKHGGLDTVKKCLACHDPHVSDYVRQLSNQPIELCMGCHDRPYDKATGSVADMKAFLADNTIHHGPIKQKDCSSCHNTHGSSNFRMLRAYFPPLFYAGYSPDNYRLCFMCHESSLAEEELTETLTGFRDGDRNLHYVHVNKFDRGRTCRACHDAHATNNPRHIRDAVPFGRWEMPVGLVMSETGGSCLPGCHQEFAYDRKEPVANRREGR